MWPRAAKDCREWDCFSTARPETRRMSKSPPTHSTRFIPGIPAQAICMLAGMTLAFSPAAAPAQEEKPAAKPATEAPAEAEKDKEAAPPVTPRDKETALKEFKADMAALKKWTKSKEAEAKNNPLMGLTMIKDMAAKIVVVRTDGLPDDLGAEYKKMTGIIKDMAALFKDMPADEAALQTWLQSKFSDPGFGQKMQEFGEAAKTTGEKLKEIGKKYGIQELDFHGDDEEAGEENDKKEDKGDAGKTEKPDAEKVEK
jgi:hypothetical protein